MVLPRGVSLADKCQLMFGGAIVLIMGLALVAPWVRLGSAVEQSQLEASRQYARLWAGEHLDSPQSLATPRESSSASADGSGVRVRYMPWFEWEKESLSGEGAESVAGFRAEARRRFDTLKPGERAPMEVYDSDWDGKARVTRYAMLVFGEQAERTGVLLVERRSVDAGPVLWWNRLIVLTAMGSAAVLALGVFWYIITRVVLEPVRQLRETAEMVRAGQTGVRSEIHTGDEFEELAEAFNSMLQDLTVQQQQLRGVNRTLDLELTKLAERNLALYDAARLKGEFLARVSHELRTPMNAIIGFAELLQETAKGDHDSPDRARDADRIAKRLKYVNNILSAGRTLLEMINDLLAMARIEAGNIDVSVQEMSVAESCEGLLALIKPLADKKSIRLKLQLPGAAPDSAAEGDSNAGDAELPHIRTDPKKFEQVVFNFLSNAVKFTPEGGQVTLRAERLRGADGVARVRVSVLDTGPGIPREQHAYVFERFTQIDGSRTREHHGTGLGLAIAKEFAELLQGEIQLVSEPGRGSMFSLIVPVDLDEGAAREAASRVVGRVRERGGVGGS